MGQAGLEIVKFARDAKVVWHKNIVGNTRAFFGDLCGAKKAYARAERRKNPKYLQDVEQASLLIKELKGLLDILNKGRIDRNHNLTKSTVMEVSFKCDSLDGKIGQKCSVTTNLNFLINSSSFSSIIPAGEGSEAQASILSLLDSNFIVSLGSDCDINGCKYAQQGLGMDAYFIESADQEDMYLDFKKVNIYTPPSVNSNTDTQVTITAIDGTRTTHSLARLSGNTSGNNINYHNFKNLAESAACKKTDKSACNAISDYQATCQQAGGAILYPACCGTCKVFEQYKNGISVSNLISKNKYVDYHIASCFKGQKPTFSANGKSYSASCGTNLVSVDGILLKFGEPSSVEEKINRRKLL